MSIEKINSNKNINQNTGAVINAPACRRYPTKNIFSIGYSKYGNCGYFDAKPILFIESNITWTDGDSYIYLDQNAIIIDNTSRFIQSINIQCSNLLDVTDEVLTIGGTSFILDTTVTDNSMAGITVFSIDYNSVTKAFEITSPTGLIPIGDAELLIRSISYNNIAASPTGGTRSFAFTINDGINISDIKNIAVLVVESGNQSPVVDLNSLTGGNNSLYTFTQGDEASYVIPNVDLSDVDGATLTSITIVGTTYGSDAADESIEFGAVQFPSNVNGSNTLLVGSTTFALSYNSTTKTINITKNGGGSFPIADGQALLEIFTYYNTANPITEGDRIFTFVVNDGISDSAISTLTISVVSAGLDQEVERLSLISWNRPFINLLAGDDISTQQARNLHVHTYAGE